MTSISPSIDPATWHRTPCWVTDRLILTGDLHETRDQAVEQLGLWRAEGVTDILDVREEYSDKELVAEHAPEISYFYLGTHDNGGRQSDHWFVQGIAVGLDVLEDPERTLLVHCHKGINRAPSMVFAILLASGWDPIEALEAIRAARPIANILYSDSAISWWLRSQGASPTEVKTGVKAVRQWHRNNPIDVGFAISRIRLGGTNPGGN